MDLKLLSCLGMMVCILFGVDIYIALGVAAVIGLSALGVDGVTLLAEKFIQGLDHFPLLAIPLFILAGHLMASGGIARRLVNVLMLALGRVPGGLGHVTMLSTFALSGVSGSASADTAAIGAVTIPEMRRHKYPMPFAAAVTASAGATGHLLPPSIDLIIVGVVSNVSVAAMFLAGVFPAIFNLATMLVLTTIMAMLYRFPKVDIDRSVWLGTLIDGLPALGMPVIILGGIRAGLFTPTEAAGVAVLYSAMVGLFIYREIDFGKIPTLMVDACRSTGAVLFVIAMASAMSFYFTFEQVPADIAHFIKEHATSTVSFLLWVNVVFLLVGMVMDALPALIVLMPILVPLAESYGLHPLHFCIIVLANVGLSFIHPPVGLCLYIASAISKAPLGKVMLWITPFVLVLALNIVLLALFPEVTLWLPRIAGKM
ncbi:TRAP transporter large permease subunit [Ensifer aridi]